MDYCHVANGQCLAPAGYRSGGGGIANGINRVRTTCRACGLYVCDSCSLFKGKRRICAPCVGEQSKAGIRDPGPFILGLERS